MSFYGRTETTVREYDERGQLKEETVTTVERRPVMERPPGFLATAGKQQAEEA